MEQESTTPLYELNKLQLQLPFSRATLMLPLIVFLHSTKSENKHCTLSFTVSMSKVILKIIIQHVHNSSTPLYLYKNKSQAGIAGNKCADAIATHQAIQGDDTPADRTFPYVNHAVNPFLDTTWLAFEETARTHASRSERPNSLAPKFKHCSNLHDALRTHMHSKHSLGKANIKAEKKNYVGKGNSPYIN
eukprot:759644-Pelagomonas_calceolata.AAC.1